MAIRSALPVILGLSAAMSIMVPAGAGPADPNGFDHTYGAYAKLLREHVVGPRVDYARLLRNRKQLDQVVEQLGRVTSEMEQSWTREQRLAYWTNAYNIFTLRAIVDHYPIKGSFFSFHPRNSIRQIDGVWDTLRWKAAGRSITLDEIEHGLLRPTFKEPRIHFAVNCASISCPPLRPEPYRADALDQQLEDAARSFLASEEGLQIDEHTLRVSSLFKWYGDDFVPRFAGEMQRDRGPKERAVLGVVATFGPDPARELARERDVEIAYLRYDWSLNDVHAR